MKKSMSIPSWLMILALWMTACAGTPAALPTETFPPSVEPSVTGRPIQVTPLESAFAPGEGTAAPLDDLIASHTVTFNTPDGAVITGELYGSGNTAVIFSVMGNCKMGWRELAWLTAAQRLMAFTYSWRDCGPSGPVSETLLFQNFLNDTRGAIDFVRERGADKIILAGASLGGIASAKLAIESNASGLIIFASPRTIPGREISIEAEDMDTGIPKLFLTAEDDAVVPASRTRELFDLAAEPREWQVFPGDAHGTDLFESQNGREVQEQILAFILRIAAAP